MRTVRKGRPDPRHARDQIEYVDEEPWIRQKFAEELAKNGLKSLMPDEAYKTRSFEWSYAS